ncbi:MAG: mechanosensitive ion channel family protein [Paracoccaceae bacterium]
MSKPVGTAPVGAKWAALWLIAAFFLTVLPTFAQNAETQPAVVPDTPEAAAAMVARLSDEEVRSLLLDRLKAAEAEKADLAGKSAPVADRVVDLLIGSGERIFATAVSSPETLRQAGSALASLASEMGAWRIVRLLGALAAGAFAGVVLTAQARRIFRSRREATGLSVARRAFGIYLWEMAALALGFVVASLALTLTARPEDLAVGRLLAVWLLLVPWFGIRTLALFLAPNRPELRLAAVDDRAARLLFNNAAGILIFAGLSKSALGLLPLSGADEALIESGFWLNVLVFLWFGLTVVISRDGLRQIMRGGSDILSPTDRFIARHYPAYAAAVIGGAWVASALMATAGLEDLIHEGRHILTMAILLVAPLFDTAIRSAARSLSAPPSGDGAAALDAHEASLRSMTRIGRAVVISVVFILLARLWEIRVSEVASLGMGAQVAARVVSTVYICLAGYFAWELTRLWFHRKLAGEKTAHALDPLAEDSTSLDLSPGSSRLATVLPVVSWALQAAIVVMTVLVALSNIGIDVTALMAGAGIVGLAIGFGSQKLVSDIVSGLFFLFEDAFRIGEYVEVGSAEGTVEKFSLRSLHLRHSRGAIYCIPYSTIPRVTNFGRDWGIMKMRFTVPHGTDVEKVRKIFKRIGQEMLANPELAPGFIEPFKSQGVREITETGIVVAGKFTFKPGGQFIIRREVFKRVQEEFDKAGIPFARQEVRVAMVGQDGTEAAAAGAAASAAIARAVPDAPQPG